MTTNDKSVQGCIKFGIKDKGATMTGVTNESRVNNVKVKVIN